MKPKLEVKNKVDVKILKYLFLLLLAIISVYTSNIVFQYNLNSEGISFIILFCILSVFFGLKELIIIDNNLEKRYRFDLIIRMICLLLCGPIQTLIVTFISNVICVPLNELKSREKFSIVNVGFFICNRIISVNVLCITFTLLGGKVYDANFPENVFAILLAASCEFLTYTFLTVFWNSIGINAKKILKTMNEEYLWISRYDLWQTIYAILISNTIIIAVINIKDKFLQNNENLNGYDLFLVIGIFIVVAILYYPLQERMREFKTLLAFNRQNAELKKFSVQLRDSNKRITRAFAAMLEKRDAYTSGHSERVALYSVIIAKKMGFSEERCQQLEMAGLLHDIGKMAIELDILNKTTRLTDEEYAKIKMHPVYGRQLLEKIYGHVDKKDDEFNLICDIAINHHERWDGKGYPNKILGEDISLEARILSVADALDAMTSDRSYRDGLDFEVAVKEIKRNSGIQFCPYVVKAFLECVEDGSIKVYKESNVSNLLSSYE